MGYRKKARKLVACAGEGDFVRVRTERQAELVTRAAQDASKLVNVMIVRDPTEPVTEISCGDEDWQRKKSMERKVRRAMRDPSGLSAVNLIAQIGRNLT